MKASDKGLVYRKLCPGTGLCSRPDGSRVGLVHVADNYSPLSGFHPG